MSFIPVFVGGGSDVSAGSVKFALDVNETVEVGHVLASFSGGTYGILRKASSATNQVIGMSANGADPGDVVEVIQHGTAIVKMDSAPATTDNGKAVYLSTTNGIASLIAPSTSGHNVILLGYLINSDGVNTTPQIIVSIKHIVRLG
tara:strand:+ start:220 stop:657 length:438 start_codon:yes stop_codon:yes gene_type:complete